MSNRLRIVHIYQWYMDSMGYQENYLPRYQASLGNDVTIITSTRSPQYPNTPLQCMRSGKHEDHGVTIIRLRTVSIVAPSGNTLVFMSGLYSALNRARPEVVFHHNTSEDSLRAAGAYKIRHPSTLLALDSHLNFANSGKSWVSARLWHGLFWRWQLQRVLPLVDKVFAVTPACAQFEREVHGIPANLVEVLPLGCDDENQPPRDEAHAWLRHKANWPSDTRVVVIAGKLDRNKRAIETVSAFRMLDDEAARLAIVGSIGPDISQELVGAIGGDTRIGLFGWVSADELAWWLRGADIGVWPGTESSVWVQAVGSGLPVILHHVPGREDLTAGGNGILLESAEPAEIYECLKKALDDAFLPNLVKSASEVAPRFSYAAIARQSLTFASAPEKMIAGEETR
ncbi:MAG: hypothetical protein C0398_07375 [Coprothermobacter sp.]|nr:hypothetical protein [Coprothermobacter sp.]